MCLFVACGLWSAAAHSQSYTFTTFAGLAGVSGSVDAAGSNARFYQPTGVAVDSTGNIYVAEKSSAVRKITPEGVVSTFAGVIGTSGSADGVGSAARFAQPRGLAVDNADNLYVADSLNNTIRKVTPTGMVSTLAGRVNLTGSIDGTGLETLFNSPGGIALDSAGDLYVADTFNGTIRLGHLSSTTPPSLHFNFAPNRLVLSWPQSADNYVVEASSTLLPAAAWTPVSNPVSTSGDSFVLTNTLDTSARFYRLRKP